MSQPTTCQYLQSMVLLWRAWCSALHTKIHCMQKVWYRIRVEQWRVLTACTGISMSRRRDTAFHEWTRMLIRFSKCNQKSKTRLGLCGADEGRKRRCEVLSRSVVTWITICRIGLKDCLWILENPIRYILGDFFCYMTFQNSKGVVICAECQACRLRNCFRPGLIRH